MHNKIIELEKELANNQTDIQALGRSVTNAEKVKELKNRNIDIKAEIKTLKIKIKKIEKEEIQRDPEEAKRKAIAEEKEKPELDPFDAFMQTEGKYGEVRYSLLQEFKKDIFKNFYSIDGALYKYNTVSGTHERIETGMKEEILKVILTEKERLPDETTLRALYSIHKNEIKNLNFTKQNTCISFKGELLNIWTMQPVEKKPENIAIIYIDASKNEMLKNDSGNIWKEYLYDQYGEEQAINLLGFLFGAILNENLEVGAIIESNGRSGKGTLQETLTALLGSKQCNVFQSYDLIEKFRLKSVLDSKVAFFDEVEALSSSKFKTLTGNKRAKVELKGKDVEEILYTTSMIFFSNEVVEMKSFKFAEKERLCLFRGKGLGERKPDPTFKERMINNKLDLLKLILTVGMAKFKECGKILYHNEEMAEEYEETNNSLEELLKQYLISNENARKTLNDLNKTIVKNFESLENYLGRDWKNLTTTKQGKLLTEAFGKDIKVKSNGLNCYKLVVKMI